MKFARTRRGLAAASIAATVATVGLASAVPAVAAARPAVSSQSQPAASRIGIITCLHHAVVRPHRYVLACADHGNFLTGLRWRVWGWRGTAYGHGTQVMNNCKPNCASGRFIRYPVLATLWRVRSARHGHGPSFSRLTLIYPHRRPPHTGATATYGLLS